MVNMVCLMKVFSSVAPVVSKLRVDLKYPNIAVDQFGNIGSWTMVYNQVLGSEDLSLHHLVLLCEGF